MPEKLEVVLTPEETKLSTQRSNLLVNILFLYNKQGDITPTELFGRLSIKDMKVYHHHPGIQVTLIKCPSRITWVYCVFSLVSSFSFH